MSLLTSLGGERGSNYPHHDAKARVDHGTAGLGLGLGLGLVEIDVNEEL